MHECELAQRQASLGTAAACMTCERTGLGSHSNLLPLPPGSLGEILRGNFHLGEHTDMGLGSTGMLVSVCINRGDVCIGNRMRCARSVVRVPFFGIREFNSRQTWH